MFNKSTLTITTSALVLMSTGVAVTQKLIGIKIVQAMLILNTGLKEK